MFGARQTGKSTLIRSILPDDALVFDLSDPSQRAFLLLLQDGSSMCTGRFMPQMLHAGYLSMRHKRSRSSSMRCSFSTMKRSACCQLTGGRVSFSVAARPGGCGDQVRIYCPAGASCIACIRSRASNMSHTSLLDISPKCSLKREARSLFFRFRMMYRFLRPFLNEASRID